MEVGLLRLFGKPLSLKVGTGHQAVLSAGVIREQSGGEAGKDLLK